MANALFTLGRTLITPGALSAYTALKVVPQTLLSHHVTGDWGDLDDEDMARNQEAIREGSRIFSSYNVGQHKVYVITEADRTVTTIFLAGKY